MAVRYNSNLMGKLTIKQGEKKFKIEIRQGNCLADFIHVRKDEEGDGYIHTLYSFFSNEAHLKRIIKNKGKVFWDEVVSIELNCKYKECLTMLKHIVKYHKVKCYYK